MSVLAMILAGGTGPGLNILTAHRSEAAVPFGGKYRVIDFPLSNCVNSDIYDVAVLTQYMPRSLNDHIRAGKPWDLDRAEGGVRMLQPYQSSAEETGAWQDGSAEAIRFNLDFVEESNAEMVLLLSGNHIYKMNYMPLLDFHKQRKADVTVAVRAVAPHLTNHFGMVATDAEKRISRFEEKPRRTRSIFASMGIYVFNKQVLIDWLRGPGKQHKHLGKDVLTRVVKRKRAYAYEFEGYWANVGSVPAYYEVNMALLADIPALDLSDPYWVIHTRSEQYPPVRVGASAAIGGNLVSDGAVIEGRAERSIIGPGVHIEAGAAVTDSIVLTNATIAANATVDRAIVDKSVHVGEGARIGVGDDNTPNTNMPDVLNTGITLVGKWAKVPAGIELGRNVSIRPRTVSDQYPEDRVPSGTTI